MSLNLLISHYDEQKSCGKDIKWGQQRQQQTQRCLDRHEIVGHLLPLYCGPGKAFRNVASAAKLSNRLLILLHCNVWTNQRLFAINKPCLICGWGYDGQYSTGTGSAEHDVYLNCTFAYTWFLSLHSLPIRMFAWMPLKRCHYICFHDMSTQGHHVLNIM